MSTVNDYDARRGSDVDVAERSALRDLGPAVVRSSPTIVDEDPNDVPFFELPGADLSGEELTMAVIPMRSDEFTCSSCFLVQHRTRQRGTSGGHPICADCA
jgi:hypothetical protein